ncbi:MAG TPA: ATP-binding protein [Verrucomicrobiae bacterium]
MIFRSIKWSLQLWHGIILLLVLAGFGYTAFELQRTRELRRVDQELQDRLALIFTPRPRPAGEGRRPGLGERADELIGPGPGRREGNFPSEEFGTNQNRRPLRARFGERMRDLRLPEELPPNFGAPDLADESGIYHVIWRREQRMRSSDAPEDLERPKTGDAVGPRTRGLYREYVRFTPRGDVIVVGRSIAHELAEFRKLSLLLLGTGAGILALGLVGGWFVASRAMRPIESISSTALKIASGDLSQRIPQGETESELGRVVSVLNSTFARLESAFTQQLRFTTDVSHELRTPVAVIVSQTQLALGRERPAAEYRQTLEACQRAAQRMRGLIESLMQLARLDGGQEHFERKWFDLARVAHDALELIEPLAHERGLKLHTELTTAQTQGDAERISQVIVNLLTNAIHYTPKGAITVVTGVENNFAVVRVNDTGIGIPPADLPRIFDRFYRVEKSRSREKGGSGLGLAISKAIVTAHSGSIEAVSEVSRGTTVTVRLPITG